MIVDRGYNRRLLLEINKIEFVSLICSILVIVIINITKPYKYYYFVIALPLLIVNAYNAEHFRALMHTKRYLIITLMPTAIFASFLTIGKIAQDIYIYGCIIAAVVSTLLQWQLMHEKKIWQNQIYIIYRCINSSNTFFNSKMKRTLRESLIILKGSVAILATKYLDILILGMFVSAQILGMYDVAQRITMFISAPLVMVAPLIIPAVRKLKKIDQKKLFYLIQIFCGAIACIIAILIINYAELIEEFFNINIKEIEMLIKILAFGYLVNSITGPSGMVLLANDLTKQWAKIVMLNFIFYAPVLLISIKYSGVYGAALIYSTSLVLINLTMYYELFNFYKNK
jgi:O-antigen/teichoic acid export membrane protein